jgi:hypothetical protein
VKDGDWREALGPNGEDFEVFITQTIRNSERNPDFGQKILCHIDTLMKVSRFIMLCYGACDEDAAIYNEYNEFKKIIMMQLRMDPVEFHVGYKSSVNTIT